MGDFPLEKDKKDLECVYFLLQVLHHQRELIDEIYCQLIKQLTNNKSVKLDSCLRGWRLMSLICTYYKPSDLLKPYLIKYLENNAYDSKRTFSGIIILINYLPFFY